MNRFLLVALLISSTFSCHRRHHPRPTPEVVVQPAVIPDGAEKLCWDQPKVIDEKNGPGVDERGEWYHPAYTAVREVKQGRWVKCSEMKKAYNVEVQNRKID